MDLLGLMVVCPLRPAARSSARQQQGLTNDHLRQDIMLLACHAFRWGAGTCCREHEGMLKENAKPGAH